ncbi:MAG TPA: hypothetical protein PLT46_04455 [Burkholderiaceae bacterium]|nr:hypothetical protein [Burkholderiaceae bacterium]
MRKVPFGLGDVDPVDTGHRSSLVLGTVVAFKAEQHERGKDQQKQQKLHDLGVLPDEIKHAQTLNIKNRKGERYVRLYIGGGGC